MNFSVTNYKYITNWLNILHGDWQIKKKYYKHRKLEMFGTETENLVHNILQVVANSILRIYRMST